MLFVLYLVCILLICVNAEYTVRCNNETNPSINSVTLVPSPDHVGGRYVMEWCTAAGANITAWEFYINYNISMNPNQCKHYNFIHDSKFAQHSRLEENTNINLNCSHVCFSTSIDLIFKACYHIKNQVTKGRIKMRSYDQLIYITNNFTNITVLKNSAPAATSYNSDEYASVQWFTGSVPAAKFTMYLNSITESGAGGAGGDVTQNCTSAVYTVTCRLRVPPGSYSLMFRHTEPWTYGRIAVDTVSKDFNRTAAGAEVELGVGAGVWGVWGVWGAWGACGALALCVPAALLLYRACARSPPHTKRDEAGAGAGAALAAGGAGGGVRVLLLYARDCAALVSVARRLGALLQEVVGEGAVYDVYAAEVSAQFARAPAEWLRAVLCREEVRVVVLQTPAAACLYAAQLRQRGYTLALEQPLLGRGAAPRRPHCADALLQLALRLMCESAHAHRFPYRKYYVAEISGLEANVVPLVTPQRRYLLPAATALLLRDLAASAPPAPGAPPAPPEPPEQRLAEPLAQFSRAVEELQEYVRENPDYLNDELIFH